MNRDEKLMTTRRRPKRSRTEGNLKDWIITPGGLRHRSRVHRIEPGRTELFSGASELLGPKSDAAGASSGSNWITYATWNKTGAGLVTSFSSTWSVPDDPSTKANQLIYLFHGMQSADGQIIVQPVLQWGVHPNDPPGTTGLFWTIASWIVVGPKAHFTPHVRAYAGDILSGLISLVGQPDGGFAYSCEFEGFPQTVLLTSNIASSFPELVQCVWTLEAYETQRDRFIPYDLDDSSEYPDGAVTFGQISVGSYDPVPGNQLVFRNPAGVYGEHTTSTIEEGVLSEVIVSFS